MEPQQQVAESLALDGLARLWNALEERVRSYGVSLEIRVGGLVWTTKHCGHGKGWRLCAFTTEGDHLVTKPIAECSLIIRLELAASVAEFMLKLQQERQRLDDLLPRALKTLRDALEKKP